MIYAGIGSRNIPNEIAEVFEYLGKELALRGYTLRSGGAEGADTAFEEGCDIAKGKKEIYLPWKEFNGNTSPLYLYDNIKEAVDIAIKFHPCWDALSRGGRALQIRNSFQVLGLDLNTPADFIICYTKNGSGMGGTGQALRIAKEYDIKVCDFGRFPKEKAMAYANKVLNMIDKELNKVTLVQNKNEEKDI